ncbi:LysR family transcriptional regulator [Actinokineospora globicatena]|uniref:LysR family transcriptional regulator n=1 Tax=Actinokineospora globicatena TaxID=103729 RepID=UPI0020A2FEF4|nr:LysR family transcriptional regulator [Actinokineospora globicatena]MCP2304585.1 DNA-binding transcriptional regulator, LysR family [Actinokineospora globicatena]GLW78044.1 LysR family transcriptional regulator [Actinokineospora globicatena]GLW85290.1 LysR family transcriptional regulator [Actinokineospora globicatena]
MTVELRHLRAFLAIAEEGGITRAAVRLHLTQPALSRMLKALEDHLGARLVDRSTHHLRLTDAGHAFRTRAATAVAAVDAALDPQRAGTWPLRVGHAWSALGQHTTTVLRRWGTTHPSMPLELLRFDDRTAGLSQGRVDAALLRVPPNTPGTRATLLFTEPRMVAVPSDSALATHPDLVLAALTHEIIVVNPVSGSTTLTLWPPETRPTTVLNVDNTDDWLAAIASARGIGVTSSATATLHPYPGVTYLPLTDAPALPLHLVWNNPPSHPAVTTLADFIREIAQ